jgi:hypothetical protein
MHQTKESGIKKKFPGKNHQSDDFGSYTTQGESGN